MKIDFRLLSLTHETYETQGSMWLHEDPVRSTVLKTITALGCKEKVLDLEECPFWASVTHNSFGAFGTIYIMNLGQCEI